MFIDIFENKLRLLIVSDATMKDNLKKEPHVLSSSYAIPASPGPKFNLFGDI
jgi:hypothetical protein